MKRSAALLFLTLLITACASPRPTAPAGTTTQPATFTGEVWTWDEKQNIVTLRQGERTIRVKVSPDQMRTLRLHQVTTLRGELAGPAEIPTTVVTVPAAGFVPRGQADQLETSGTVSATDPAGKVTVASQHGPLVVWIGQPNSTPFQNGERVQLRIRVQPLDVVPAAPGQPAPAAGPEPAASVGSEPGEYAVVKGPITAIDPGGRLTMQSPRGPVTVAVPNAARYRVGDAVEVHTSVHPAR